MTLELWFLFVLASLIFVISPGPAMLLTINNSIHFGPKPTLISAFGNSVGLVVLGFAVALGLGAIMMASALLFTIIKLVGAAYLIYLGIKTCFSPVKVITQTMEQAQLNACTRFFEGFFLSITNPKAIIALAILFPQFMNMSQPVLPQVITLSVTYSVLCFLNHFCLVLASRNIKRALSSPKRMKAIKRLIGGMFIGFGAALASTTR